MNDITLRAPGTELDDLPLSQGRLAVGRAPEGGLRAVEDASARVSFCTDRRGTWLQVGEGVRGVHVNGRPVQRKALLRAGDTVYVDGVEIGLVGGVSAAGGKGVAAAAAPTNQCFDEAAPRVVLRGVSGPHHGRSLTLERPRAIGSAADADVRVESLAERHVLVAMEGAQAVLRVLARDAEVRVNGVPCRTAQLQPGDQVAFDAHHRFVLEAPTPVSGVAVEGELEPLIPREEPPPPAPKQWRMPWLLVAALLLAAALSALLLL